LVRAKQEEAPKILNLDDDDEAAKPETDAPSQESPKLEELEEPVLLANQKPKQPIKIDRDQVVLEEINKMIRDAEDQEIEDDMDEEVADCLRQAALKSPAYTKRWYDSVGDSFIHCPSLATIILDYSLIELAEEIYEEELPMLYTVSLRSIAAEVAMDEEELPEYVYRLAS
jgi:hypothetical protein